jgi:lipopolysaccharide export system protein LptA
MRLLPICFVILGLIMSNAALAQTVTADEFVVNDGANEATFSGNVVVKQPGLTVWANKVVVYYGDGGPSDLKDFEAIGNVRIQQPDQTATGDRGRYNPATKILKLSGHVVVTNESGTVSGPELVIDIANGTSKFSSQSGSGRVTGIFAAPE